MTAEGVLAAVLERRTALGRTTAVAVSGVDCAGKSTLAAWLRDRLREAGIPVVLLSGDDFLRPRAERRANPDQAVGYYRESFDYRALFRDVLVPARRGERVDVRLRVADQEHDAWRERRVVVETRSVVLVEGVFLLAGARRAAFDLAIWIDIPLEAALARARRRPLELARYGPDGIEREYARRFFAGQRLHLESDRPALRADLVLPADRVPAPAAGRRTGAAGPEPRGSEAA